MQLSATIKLMVTIKQNPKKICYSQPVWGVGAWGGDQIYKVSGLNTDIIWHVLIGYQTPFKVVAFVIAQICKLYVGKKL